MNNLKDAISDILTIMFHQKGITDNTDLMRCNIFCMFIHRKIKSLPLGEELNLNHIKGSTEYNALNQNIALPDSFLLELIDRANILHNTCTQCTGDGKLSESGSMQCNKCGHSWS